MRKRSTQSIALCGILSALGTMILLLGGLIPGTVYATPLLAAIFLVAVKREAGNSFAWSVWAVTSTLSIILGTEKEAAFFYLFVGWYPAFRPLLQRLKQGTRLILKILIFTVAVSAMYAFLGFVLHLEAVMEDFGSVSTGLNIAFFVLLVGTLLIYDVLLGRFELIYEYRIRKKLRFRS